jgi:hypothetical protein
MKIITVKLTITIIMIEHYADIITSFKRWPIMCFMNNRSSDSKLWYLYCPYRFIISKFSRCVLSNTTRQILIRTHYIGDMFRLKALKLLEMHVNVFSPISLLICMYSYTGINCTRMEIKREDCYFIYNQTPCYLHIIKIQTLMNTFLG